MAKEIERKFLVKSDDWRPLAEGKLCRQGYLSTVKERTVRIRVINGRGYVTIKGISTGPTRAEFEYEIPVADADALLTNICEKPIIEKTRFTVQQGPLVWHVDEFSGANAGLIVAEVELENENQQIALPAWAGKEVTGEAKYYNSNLVRFPYKDW